MVDPEPIARKRSRRRFIPRMSVRATMILVLCLNGTRITDAGLIDLDGLAACAKLEAGGTAVTDDVLREAMRKRSRDIDQPSNSIIFSP